jgi:squalene-hopene/tetraprenyl-beta-curcumene cyclase
VLAAVLVAQAAIATVAWRLLDGPGDARAQVAIRVSFAALALAAWGLSLALARARLDPGLAAATAALIGLVLVWGPAPGQTLAQASGEPVRYRSLGFAVSPPYAASVALGLDVIHAPAFYGRIPAVQLETHMTTWTRTAGGLALAGSLFSFLGLAGRRRNRAALITALALAVGGVGCKGKDGEAKKAPAPAPAPAPTPAPTPAPVPPPAPPAVKGNPTVADIDAAITRGIDALVKGRGADGQIGGHPGTTSLAVLAMTTAGVGKDDPRLAPSLGMLATLAKPDGSIYEQEYPVYVTAMSALAFQQAGAYPELVAKAQRWLADKQFAENNKVDLADINYGGIGYGVDAKAQKADLSNLEVALDALKDSQLADKAEVMKRAQRFIERCQNRTESNDQKWASNDGGFVYQPGSSKAGGTASSASMTYTGIASYLYTAADAKDPRVAAAIEWVKGHYSVDENPGLGQKGLYFHFHMMGRALGLIGQRTFADSDGRNHDWPVELAAKVLSLQKPDGTWVNPDGTYWESNPVMATSRSVLALAHARAAMK